MSEQESMTEQQDTEAEAAVVDRDPIANEKLRQIVEGLLIAAGKPLSLNDIAVIFEECERPEKEELRAVLDAIAADCEGRGYELKEVASGFRFQVRETLSQWVSRLWEERPQRYTRALLETLALIAYRQPITRGDIEEIRGVSVSSTIIRTLLDREWIRVVGHRDVPGRPAMFASTRQFLDYFNLRSLQDLPPLSEIRDLDQLNQQLPLEDDTRDMRVLDLPDESDVSEFDDEIEARDRAVYADEDLPDEEEAMALAKRPLDDILATPRELDDDQGNASDGAANEDNEAER